MEPFSLAESLKPPVVLYLRVSSDKQREAQTIEGQRDALLAFCARENITVAATITDDGVNGDLPFEARPGARELLALAASGNCKTVLVYMYDRFSRNLLEGLLAARTLRQSGASARSLLEPFDITTPWGEYMFSQSLNNAQLFKAQLLERTNNGRRRAARLGKWKGGLPPYGYRLANSFLVPAEEEDVLPGMTTVAGNGECSMTEAGIVRYIFQAIGDEGRTASSLAVYFNSIGLLSPSASKNKAAPNTGWAASLISRMVHRTFYKGVYTYTAKASKSGTNQPEVITTPCPALVSVEQWEKAQAVLTRNQIQATKNRIREYLFTGLIRCAHCGSSYTGITESRRKSGIRQYYRCSRSLKHTAGIRAKCPARTIYDADLYKHVTSEIEGFLCEPDAVLERVAKTVQELDHAATAEPLPSHAAAIEAALASKASEKNAVLTLYRRGRITEAELDAQLDAIEAETIALNSELQKNNEKTQRAEADRAAIITAAEHLRELAQKHGGKFPADFDEARVVLHAFIESISIETFGEGKNKRAVATVSYRFDRPPSQKNNIVVNRRINRVRSSATTSRRTRAFLPVRWSASRTRQAILSPQATRRGERSPGSRMKPATTAAARTEPLAFVSRKPARISTVSARRPVKPLSAKRSTPWTTTRSRLPRPPQTTCMSAMWSRWCRAARCASALTGRSGREK